MADVINRTTLQYLRSVNEPSYPEPTWKWNPDMSQVVNVVQRFQKWDVANDRPIPMDAGEQAAVVATALAAQRDAAVAALTQIENVQRAFMLVVLDEINVLRSAAALSARTEQQLRTAVRNKLGA